MPSEEENVEGFRASTPRGAVQRQQSNTGVKASPLPTSSGPTCCASLLCENQLLRRALRKEREKRQFVADAYNKLLENYKSLVEFKKVVELSSPLTTSCDEAEIIVEDNKGATGSRQQNKRKEDTSKLSMDVQNLAQKFQQTALTKSPKRKKVIQKTPMKDIANRQEVSKRNNRMSVRPKTTTERTEERQPENERMIERPASANPLWYFVPLDENSHDTNSLSHMLRMQAMFGRSQARCHAIREASRARASVAANRRAVVADLLKGKRELDEDAIQVLHADSSRISAFPHEFMHQMRTTSKRNYNKSPIRQNQERERQRMLEQATNRILAHSSAAISKMIAKTRSSSGSSSRTFVLG